jgi:UDP-N-acetylmuramoylalanine--D-glutamate ligase
MGAYASAKARVWDGTVAIGNADDVAVASMLASAAASAAPSVSAARRVGFTLGRPSTGQLGVLDGTLIDRAFGLSRSDLSAGIALAEVADVSPSGAHNVANALAAAALTRAVGVAPEAVAAGLRAFVPDPHRNQFVLRRQGVNYVDDSKATNPHAAAASLSAYESIVWVAGGQLKGAPIDELVAQVAGRLRAVVLLGVDRGEIAAALARHAPDVPAIEVGLSDDRAMIEVVAVAARHARPGDTVLLAPAAASYDMFSGYAARGDAFAAAVRALGPA